MMIRQELMSTIYYNNQIYKVGENNVWYVDSSFMPECVKNLRERGIDDA